jgi:hypothetical protein
VSVDRAMVTRHTPWGIFKSEVYLRAKLTRPRLLPPIRPGAVVIDVRESDEYVAGHVPGARLNPLSTLGSRGGAAPWGAGICHLRQRQPQSRGG